MTLGRMKSFLDSQAQRVGKITDRCLNYDIDFLLFESVYVNSSGDWIPPNYLDLELFQSGFDECHKSNHNPQCCLTSP